MPLVPLDVGVEDRVLQYYSPRKLEGFLLSDSHAGLSLSLPVIGGGFGREPFKKSIRQQLTEAGRLLERHGSLVIDAVPDRGDYLLTRFHGSVGVWTFGSEPPESFRENSWLEQTVWWHGLAREFGLVAWGHRGNLLDGSSPPPNQQLGPPVGSSIRMQYEDVVRALRALTSGTASRVELPRYVAANRLLNRLLFPDRWAYGAVFDVLLRVDDVVLDHHDQRADSRELRNYVLVCGSPLWVAEQHQLVPGVYELHRQVGDDIETGLGDYDGTGWIGVTEPEWAAFLVLERYLRLTQDFDALPYDHRLPTLPPDVMPVTIRDLAWLS
ncbi:MAG: hypothetical protein LBR33_09775 [Propionibacteriaceae bacterium]|jgi:hypothetical protein|nr:hypothetical protein [Propionibacteriaceae bacterium]